MKVEELGCGVTSLGTRKGPVEEVRQHKCVTEMKEYRISEYSGNP